VANGLSPGGLAGLCRWLAEQAPVEGPADPDLDTVDGRPVVAVRTGVWTALLTRQAPRELVRLGGSLDGNGPLRPVPTGDADAGRWGYRAGDAVRAGADAPPYLAVVVTPADGAEADATRAAVVATEPQRPQLDVEVLAADSTGPLCTWTVRVTNNGTAPGGGVLYALAQPGMSPTSVAVPTLLPGASITTAPMTFPNPAPVIPGHSTSVVIHYHAWVRPDPAGDDTGARRRLADRGIDPDRDLPAVHEAFRPTFVGLADLLTRHADPSDPDVGRRALAALRTAAESGLLTELKALVDSGRLDNPRDLADSLLLLDVDVPFGQPPEPATIGRRLAVGQAATIVTHDATARIVLNGDTVLDTTNRRAYQIRSVSSDRLRAAVRAAAERLNGVGPVPGRPGVRATAPPGYARIARVFLEQPSVAFHQRPRDGLVRFLRRHPDRLGLRDAAGAATVDILFIVNARGAHSWPKEEFGDLGQPG
jgi:hypothetical protein